MIPLEVRQHLIDAMKADFVGPFVPEGKTGGGQEVLPLPPSRWYLTGFLAPQGGVDPDPDDTEAEGELAAGGESQAEDAGNAEPESKRGHRFPASMGLSVFLPPEDDDTDYIHVEVRYAYYDKVDIAEDTEKRQKAGWKRVPCSPPVMKVPLEPKLLASGIPVPLSVGVKLRGELRTTSMEGMENARVLSLFIVNEKEALERDKDLHFIFQVEFALRYDQGFLPRPNRRGIDGNDPDQRVGALLFRDKFEWAVGHNTSVAQPIENEDGKVIELQTTQLPSYEVLKVKHETVNGVEIRMQHLSNMDGTALKRALSPLGEAYVEWISKQRYEQLDNADLEKTRDLLMSEAAICKQRIEEGILLLEKDEQIRKAFCMANLAMHVSAKQADLQREDQRYKEGKEPPGWRPFQLAFVIMNLACVAHPEHQDRTVADLIYFPTGGGKTEAYLGLIAYTLILRRLKGKSRPDEGRGVAVMLRYTLRLLTLDQLGRAATLICALEGMRQRDPSTLGNSRFAVGLWVGQRATANSLKQVNTVLNDHTPGRTESPFPLTTCPWCGTSIRIRNIKLIDDKGKPSKTKYTRAVVYCDGDACLFTENKRAGQGLPVLFVDEQIYHEVPDFLVATVDKYAMMPWRGEAGMLFGRAIYLDSKRAYGVMHPPSKDATPLPDGLYPPELIVQDELHLITGPLGTMVGLYETAIDYLCQKEIGGQKRVPKIVCSTATVRRAKEQIKALFDRKMAIFPPRGINDGDNFFSTVNKDESGRVYVGVAAPGRALRAVSVRTYATLLAAAQKHFDPKGEPAQPADPYMTMVGYFNSLRELGGMRRLVEDEVKTRVGDFSDGKRPHHYLGPHPYAADRKLQMPAELTSRESTENVKTTKARLATRRSARADDNTPEPLDVVLASNMISVGLDVDRLGLLVVNGQPKNTSENIQATSRVGRAYPGLVVTCLNTARPRDRSHFERFVAYHHSFYRNVEATTVTPFSLQTLDRGLVGTILSMVRHDIDNMEPPTGVMNIHDNRTLANELVEALVSRGREHRDWYDDDAEDRIADELRARSRNFLDAWERIIEKAKEGAALRTYSDFDHEKQQGKALMYVATDDPPADFDEKRFCAPTSMRDVEPNTHIWLRFKQLDER